MPDPSPAPSESTNQPVAATAEAAASAAAPATSAAPGSATTTTTTPPAKETAAPAAATDPAKPAAAAPATAEKPAAAAAATTEVKPVDDKGAAPPAPVIPESYEIKPPQGVTLDSNLLSALTPAFKAAGLTQEGAQKLADAFIGYQAGAPARMLERDMELLRKDPELGGANLGSTIANVNRALSMFSTLEDRKALSRIGMSNRPELVRLFARVGEAIGNDGVPDRGRPEVPAPKSRADRMYSGTKKAGE